MSKSTRRSNLLPGGIPKYIHCYDDGGSGDRYTVVYTGRYRHKTGGDTIYVGMSSNSFHPQGIGQHGSSRDRIDTNRHGYAPAIGHKCHLGVRIPFEALPVDCQRLVMRDYTDLWEL